MGIWLISIFGFLFVGWLIGIYKQYFLVNRCNNFSRIYTKDSNCHIRGYVHYHPNKKG